ncbi:hypothetical protein EW145_g7823 [Phellinidium pouzarii]|uniref:Protein kinase domain-containing protein n=1 Tax=Phellinidium pouzarii TaxID=167371 RepID=A0A4S4KDX1_9AGAM|nr:hypothetical protein EW145_g7823 [Phellinidium pouzarii]
MLIRERKPVSEDDAIRYMTDVFEGLKHLHSIGLIHRDLKPENMLFRTNHKYSPVVLADFGLAKVISNSDTIKFDGAGTLKYLPPEAYIERRTGKKADIFAVGVTLYQLLTKKHPFVSSSDNAETIRRNMKAARYRPNYYRQEFLNISYRGQDFVKWLLEKRPSEQA